MSDRVFYSIPSDTGLLNTSADSGVARGDQSSLYIGYVEDIILDHLHPDYSRYDGNNRGSIKARIIGINQRASIEALDWVRPLDSTIQEYPLIGEMVQIFKIVGDFFYSPKIPFGSAVQQNAFLNLGKALEGRTLSDAIREDGELSGNKHQFGNYFKPDSRVRPLIHFEGDVVFQGRMGQSIRFGSSRMNPVSPEEESLAPNIILRAGQGKNVENEYVTINTPFGLTLESINKDPSSIWMTSDQKVNFLPTTRNAGSFFRSLENQPQHFDGASIIANSDRVVVQAKDTHVLIMANDEIYLNSFGNTAIDTDNSILFTANKNIVSRSGNNIRNRADNDILFNAGNNLTSIVTEKTSFISNKIFIGSVEEDREPLVGGTSLSIFLARLILALVGKPLDVTSTGMDGDENTTPELPTSFPPGIHQTAHIITPMGPGLLNPTILTELAVLYNELVKTNDGQQKTKLDFSGAPFNSRDNFVLLNGETPEIVKNDFKEGEQTVVDKNEWYMNDSWYYKVV